MKFIILIFIFLTGCSSNPSRVLISPQAMEKQTISYARGGMKLHAQSVLQPELIILDYSSNQMVIGLSVTNTSLDPILFSGENLAVELKTPEGLQTAKVYTYEQLIEEGVIDKNESTLGQVGETAVGVGVGFVPFGGIAYSFGRLFYAIGSENNQTHQKRVDTRVASQLNQNYLRPQTVNPGENYSGILKIAFDHELKTGDNIFFRLSAADEIETFTFTCESNQQK